MAKPKSRVTKAADKRDVRSAIVSIDSIKLWAKNPRINDSEVPKIAASIKRYGFNAPIVVCEATREVVAGNTRYKAAKLLGLTEVPVRYVDLTPERAYEYAVADNKLGEGSKWDHELLNELLVEYKPDALLAVGFSEDELKLSLGGVVEVPVPLPLPKGAKKSSEAVVVEEALNPMTWIHVSVPLVMQAGALDALREAIGSIEGTTFTVKVMGHTYNGE